MEKGFRKLIAWQKGHQALNVAKGSLAELGYYLEPSKDLGYVNEDSYSALAACLDETGRVGSGLFKSQQ